MKYRKTTYPDGWSYIELQPGQEPFLRVRLNTYEDIFNLASAVHVHNEQTKAEGSRPLSLEIFCMPHQQHDQKFADNGTNELEIMCDFINRLNFAKVIVHRPHSDVTMALLNNATRADETPYINWALAKIDTIRDTSNPIMLMSTDANGFKPMVKLANQIEWKHETASASKHRPANEHALVQRVDREDYNGSDIVIIDDICVFGGTFIGLVDLLRQHNAGQIFVVCYHLTVKEPNAKLLECVDGLFVTNSKYNFEPFANFYIYEIPGDLSN